MRLFLSSYRAGNYPEKLVKLFGKGTKVAVITNAKDYKSPAERQESAGDLLDFLSELGLKPIELDLRSYFDNKDKLNKELSNYAAVWLAGGNAFLLRRALAYSGADKLLYDLVRKNELVYAGESAGAILATPSLTGASGEGEDDPKLVPDGYQPEIIWNGLDFISYHLVPHYQSEWSGADDMLKTLMAKNLPYKTLTDNQVLLINGAQEELLG
ncbi:Type 1 glutamine amidotransferase-like domain-containing protein [Candidatus Saccharibacteria bacterium]|nr:Type 1 glutamine amidotransferase-like domain-containing protein [Candidatus Saccharibacteria bacterium]